MLTLYYAPDSCALAAHIALVEAGLPHRLLRVDHVSKKVETGEDYAQVNPKVCVPALRLDDGQVLTESAAILQYIADRAPAAGLAPAAGSLARYRLAEWLNFAASELHQVVMRFMIPQAPPAVLAHARQRLEQRYAYVAQELASRPYLLGEHYSVADTFLYITTRWCGFLGIELSQWPVLVDYQRRIAARPGVIAALAAEGLTT